MIRLIARKVIIILIILPILNVVGFYYALAHPRLSAPTIGTVETADVSYLPYVRGLLAGDLGQVGRLSVASIIATPIKNSLVLLSIALVTAVLLGLIFGFLSISPRTRRISPQALVVLSAGSSMPGFLLGGVILSAMVYRTLYSGARATLIPLSGYGLDEHLILPVLVLAIQPAMYIAKITAGLLEHELQQDYVRVARSKGLGWFRLMWQHAWPNMLAPIMLTIGESMRLMVGALVIVEAIFVWPGIGRIFLYTIGLRLDSRPPGAFFGDPYLLASIAVILGGLLLLADLLANVLAYAFDPRLSTDSEEQAALA
ncbi:MAG: ABC transporter permease [Ardenticatenaceae bacterium]|nr:ABC transporter permease [Anaerolineales bacterium]MCB8921971.1 ABC transporter permease [Ardenticatenaceae bacterium]MCB8989547.1 ABC transporter permease [Ardenticatenaceae bacterium]MCB9003090.1 ABC transporter permease [Ardenticatenaceae bacterium]